MDTRTKILDTAARLFSSRGYDSTSLANVAKDAQVSKALIFWHFDTKENLFEAVLSRTMEPFVFDDDALRGLTPGQRLSHLVDGYVAFVQQNVASVRLFANLLMEEETRSDDFAEKVLGLYRRFRGLLEQAIADGQEGGSLARDVSPSDHAALILATLNGILVQHHLITDLGPSAELLVVGLKKSLVDPLYLQ